MTGCFRAAREFFSPPMRAPWRVHIFNWHALARGLLFRRSFIVDSPRRGNSSRTRLCQVKCGGCSVSCDIQKYQ